MICFPFRNKRLGGIIDSTANSKGYAIIATSLSLSDSQVAILKKQEVVTGYGEAIVLGIEELLRKVLKAVCNENYR